MVFKQVELSREDYLTKLPDTDRENINRLSGEVKGAMRERGINGALLAVGGVLTKRPPRPDIDTLIVLDPGENVPHREDFSSQLDFACAEFEIIDGIVTNVTGREPKFEIAERHPPTMDEEFQSPNILKHDGSIKIVPGQGTHIDVIRSHLQGVERVLSLRRGRNQPYVLLFRQERD